MNNHKMGYSGMQFIFWLGFLVTTLHSVLGDNFINFLVKPQVVRIPLKTFSNNIGITILCYDDGSYLLSVSEKPWLQSAPTYFNINGKIYSTEDGTLKLQKITQNSGEDRLGDWESIDYLFSAGGVPVITSFKGYEDIPGVIFEQTFPEGAKNTSVHDKNSIISGFPGFKIDEKLIDLGYLAFGYIFVGDMGKTIGRWNASTFRIQDGLDSGPLALYDSTGQNALFISPFDQFMSASAKHLKHQGRYYWGIMGNVAEVPKGFTIRNIIYYGNGVNDAISGWGQMLRTYYNKQSHYRDADFTNNYLSYWSDNGAYYVNYYVKGGLIQNMTYEEAMLGAKNYGDQLSLPYRSVQYSVWFKQGKYGGNGLWEPSSLLFPHGMKFMFEKTGLPATAHSRYWSPDTPYAKVNGGKYDFFVENLYAIPYDEQFWTDMFANSQQYGFKTYMQDWLNKQFDQMDWTTNNTEVARTWLMQMGEGAQKNGITIQYCMSMSRHILQSLEISSVTQARASDDYQPNDPLQWRIGISSMFAHAVGLAPFKDTFWTTTYQPGNYYKGTEPYPYMHVIISTLSTGAVGPGDMINATNATLLMRCCGSDGLILKPSRPAMVVDLQLIQSSFGGDLGPQGEVWTTYSDIGQWRFGIVFATDMHNWFKVTPSNGHFGHQFPKSQMYTSDEDSEPQVFDSEHPIVVTKDCTRKQPCLFYTSPVFQYGGQELILLGELDKVVPVSPQRILTIQWDTSDFKVKVRGAAGEMVVLTYFLGGQRSQVKCVMSAAGTAVLSIKNNECYGY